jgi:DNA invertase Pin-like site-specific DNA recombinase
MGWNKNQIEVIDCDLGQSGDGSYERRGFQYLVSEVSLGRVGIIAGIEVSRLSRSSSDWNKLLQIAALFDTLIMDEEGIYNVNDFNDRLLLGLKGTLSEVELHYLKARMQGALLNKAKRGELRRPIPIGYAYDDNKLIVKDPDAQVQEAITLFFNTFKRVGSAYSIVREYDKHGFLFPHRQLKGNKLGELSWKKLTQERALKTLKNPIYAGIYVYGKTQIQQTINGRKRKRVSKEEYHAWIPNSHPAYICETQFDENNQQLVINSHPKPDNDHGGAVREGSALLQGIAFCGICGRMMTIRYSHTKRGNQPIYTCEYNLRHYGEDACQRVAGENIDITIESLILEMINPLTLDEAISIQRELAERKEEIVRLYSQQVERARYEMDLAKRRYLCVDPDNRLVAAELESDWNQKASEYESAVIVYNRKCEAEIRSVDYKSKIALEQLISDFPKIWSDPTTSSKEKKRIARHVLEDVTITTDTSKIILGIRFKGGYTRALEIPKVKRNLNQVNAEKAAVSEIKELLCLELTYNEIAKSLNEKGLKNGLQGKPFDDTVVSSLIQRYGLPNRTTIVMSNKEGWLTAKEKRDELGIDKSTFYRMRKSGKLTYKKCSYHGLAYLYKPEGAVTV